MAETFCNSGHVKLKAGTNASTLTTAQYTDLINEAEDILCTISRNDLVTSYSTLTSNGKKILQATASSMAAQKVINYDMSGFTSRGEATMMLNVLQDEINRGMALIKDDKQKTYLGAT